MAQSGARLVEVGTTNRTRRADYERPWRDGVALLLKVHASNYRIEGFTERGGRRRAGRRSARRSSVDVGSGLLDAACPWLPGGPPAWLAGEPGVRQTPRGRGRARDVLGRQAAGRPAGRASSWDGPTWSRRAAAIRSYRAVRPGGLVLRALQEVALAYLDRTAGELPFWRMAPRRSRPARPGRRRWASGRVVDTVPRAGGGSLPGVEIPSAGVALDGDHRAALRAHGPRR